MEPRLVHQVSAPTEVEPVQEGSDHDRDAGHHGLSREQVRALDPDAGSRALDQTAETAGESLEGVAEAAQVGAAEPPDEVVDRVELRLLGPQDQLDDRVEEDRSGHHGDEEHREHRHGEVDRPWAGRPFIREPAARDGGHDRHEDGGSEEQLEQMLSAAARSEHLDHRGASLRRHPPDPALSARELLAHEPRHEPLTGAANRHIGPHQVAHAAVERGGVQEVPGAVVAPDDQTEVMGLDAPARPDDPGLASTLIATPPGCAARSWPASQERDQSGWPSFVKDPSQPSLPSW